MTRAAFSMEGYQPPNNPEIQRFEIIEEEYIGEGATHRRVNAKLLDPFVDPLETYTAIDYKVFLQRLDDKPLEIGKRHFAIWMDDTEVWEVIAPPNRKLFCRFTINSDMTQSDESKEATLTHQYGPGADHTDLTITVHNLLMSNGDYQYYGDEDDAGLAVWDYDDHWIIYDFECP